MLTVEKWAWADELAATHFIAAEQSLGRPPRRAHTRLFFFFLLSKT